jgi:hypothetical protein
MTPERIAAIRERGKATPGGPWRHVEYHNALNEGYDDHLVFGPHRQFAGETIQKATCASADLAEWLAHAVADLPDALAEIERLRAGLQTMHDDPKSTRYTLRHQAWQLLNGRDVEAIGGRT